MGDPKKNRRKYSKPSHPWQAGRLKEEEELVKKYGLKNKKEVWKMISVLKKIKKQAKNLIAGYTEQDEKEKKQLLSRLMRLNILGENSNLDDVLGLGEDNIFERRLQTMVYKLGLTKTIKQARKFIVHGHIAVNGKRVNIPSYLVVKEEEPKISFYKNSRLNNEGHPERIKPVADIKKEEEHFKEEIKKEERLVEVEAVAKED